MPTSGDLKSIYSLFCTTPLLPGMTTARPTPHPAYKSTRLRTLYEVLHEVHVINIRFHHFSDKIIFVSERAKMSQKLHNE